MTKKRNKRESQELLNRYLEGKCTKEELEAVEQWYASFDESGEVLDTNNLPDLKNEMFQNITSGIEDQELERNYAHDERPAEKVRTISLQWLKRIAAVITVGIAAGIFIYSQRHNFSAGQKNETSTLSQNRTAGERPMVTGPVTVYLPDGSVVWLNSESRLEYPEAFTDEIREVTLIGEAFFDVANDSDHPFVIHSTNFTTRVLGTSFKIKDYKEGESQEVEVVTGKVMVSLKGFSTDTAKALILGSKRKAVYSKKDNSLVESAAGGESMQMLTTRSKLEFNEVAVRDIVNVLNAAHDVNIMISNERMKNCIVTADLRNETLDLSLAILAKAINAEFSVRGKDIILSGKGCADPHPGTDGE